MELLNIFILETFSKALKFFPGLMLILCSYATHLHEIVANFPAFSFHILYIKYLHIHTHVYLLFCLKKIRIDENKLKNWSLNTKQTSCCNEFMCKLFSIRGNGKNIFKKINECKNRCKLKI